MEGNLIAIGIIITVAATAYILARYAQRRFFLWKFLAGIIICYVSATLLFPVFLTRHGIPWVVETITIFCFVQALLHIFTPVSRGLLLIAFTGAMMFGLPIYTLHLLSTGGYTCHSSSTDWHRDLLGTRLGDIADHDTRIYHANWLSDLSFFNGMFVQYAWGNRYIPHPTWHSWFTGIYRLETQPVAAWYPGGRVKDAMRHIEFRVRPGAKPPQ